MKSLIWCASIGIMILLTSTVVFADIYTTGDVWPRRVGPAISSGGDWYDSWARSIAVGDNYYGWGGFRAWNFTYTTEAGTFDWYSYLWVKATAIVDCWSGGTVDAYAYAFADVYGPAPNHLYALLEAEVTLSHTGAPYYYGATDEPYLAGYADAYEEGVDIDAMDGVYCRHLSYVDASIPQGENDRAYAYAWAIAFAYIQ